MKYRCKGVKRIGAITVKCKIPECVLTVDEKDIRGIHPEVCPYDGVRVEWVVNSLWFQNSTETDIERLPESYRR